MKFGVWYESVDKGCWTHVLVVKGEAMPHEEQFPRVFRSLGKDVVSYGHEVMVDARDGHLSWGCASEEWIQWALRQIEEGKLVEAKTVPVQAFNVRRGPVAEIPVALPAPVNA